MALDKDVRSEARHRKAQYKLAAHSRLRLFRLALVEANDLACISVDADASATMEHNTTHVLRRLIGSAPQPIRQWPRGVI